VLSIADPLIFRGPQYKPIIMMMYVMNMIVDFVVCTVTMITLRRSIKKVTTRWEKFLSSVGLYRASSC
jgi:hypothetical protein